MTNVDHRFLDLSPLPDETHYDDPPLVGDGPDLLIPCPACERTLDGIIDSDGRCDACGHVAFDV